MTAGQTSIEGRQAESEALWFRREKEADLESRMRLRELELRSFSDELSELRGMNTEQTMMRYWAASDDEIERFKRAAREYKQELEDIWIEGEANLKPQPDISEGKEPNEMDRTDASWQDEQAAKEEAIEIVNEQAGDIEENQKRLSAHYSELKQQDAEIDGSTAWRTAAALVRDEQKDTPAQEQSPQKERLTREQVESALREGSNLQNKDLSGLDLSHLSFKGINVSGSNFSGTLNHNTRYEACWMLDVNFSQAKFDSADLIHVNATGTNWKGSRFRNTKITNSDFARASFEGSVFEEDSVAQKQHQPRTKGMLRGFADKGHDKWDRFSEKIQAGWQSVRGAAYQVSERANLSSLASTLSLATSRPAALLTGNNFEGANLRNARFENVGLRNNNFRGANIEDAMFSEQARKQNLFDPAAEQQNKDVKPERLTAEQDQAAMQSWCDSLYAVGYFHPQATARDRTRIEEQLKTVISELRDVPDYQKAQEHELYSIAARHIQEIKAIKPATPQQAAGLTSEQATSRLPDEKKQDRKVEPELVKSRSHSRR